ncbi:MAG TPA: YqgE/AlgH family protein [Patescibacteria group bacterium]|nr:YqgE/AlgH family protein [Patescibacteria group bacterium]
MRDSTGSDSLTAERPCKRMRAPSLVTIGFMLWFLTDLVTPAGLLPPGSRPSVASAAIRMAAAARSTTLAGQLLVARDELRDPRFVRAVIYVVHHGATGAMGLIVNRPIGEASLSELLEQAGLDNTGIKGKIRVHFGGPVEPGQGFVLHTADYKIEGTEVMEGGIAVTARSEILRAIGMGTGPRQSLFALGYAGWAPGQLEAEIKAGAWEIVPADKMLVFDENAETKWERAMARRTIYL